MTDKPMTLNELYHGSNNKDSEVWVIVRESPTQEIAYDISEIKRYGNRVELIVEKTNDRWGVEEIY